MSSGIATLCPAWSIPGYLEVRDDHLTVNGVDAIELVEKFNSPLFVFSEARIRDNKATIASMLHSSQVEIEWVPSS